MIAPYDFFGVQGWNVAREILHKHTKFHRCNRDTFAAIRIWSLKTCSRPLDRACTLSSEFASRSSSWFFSHFTCLETPMGPRVDQGRLKSTFRVCPWRDPEIQNFENFQFHRTWCLFIGFHHCTAQIYSQNCRMKILKPVLEIIVVLAINPDVKNGQILKS